MALTQTFSILGKDITMHYGLWDCGGIAFSHDNFDLDNPETIEALKIAQALYPYFQDYAYAGEYYECYEPKYHKVAPSHAAIRDSFVEYLVGVSIMHTRKHRSEPVYIKKRKAIAGYVYLVKAITPDNHYKIGYSKKPLARIEKLDVKLPFPLDVIHLIKTNDCTTAEQYLHNMFKESRVNGEWFELTERDVATILQIDNLDYEENES